MPRLPRLFVPEYPLHITVRGNDRQDIFQEDADRYRFLACLGQAARRFDVAIHSYVLMTNHVHLLMSASDRARVSKTLQSTGRLYVAYFNDRHRRTGTLWEGRYRSTVVDADRYLLACHRYIDLNPVRGGLVSAAGDYPWSSHRFHALGCSDPLVVPHSVIEELGHTIESRREAYRRLFDQPLPAEILERIRSCSRTGWALGFDDHRGGIESRSTRRFHSLGRGWPKGRKRGPRHDSNKESDPLL